MHLSWKFDEKSSVSWQIGCTDFKFPWNVFVHQEENSFKAVIILKLHFNPPFALVCIIIYLYYNFSGSIKARCKIHLPDHLLGKCKETGTNERNESKCFTVIMLFSEGEKWRSFLRLTYPSLFKTKVNLSWETTLLRLTWIAYIQQNTVNLNIPELESNFVSDLQKKIKRS